MKLTDEDKELLSNILSAGVQFLLYVEGQGQRAASVDELEDYLNDPIKFIAAENEVSVEHYLKWKKFDEGDRRCRSLTRKGKPCYGYMPRCYRPQDFKPGVSDYCLMHREHGVTQEAQPAG